MTDSGILVMNKPQGFTSFDVIGKLRGILKMKRLGHTGTLDPMAAGVLPVLVGKATRACDILPDETKCYRAGFQLGAETDTQDNTGRILATHPIAVTGQQVSDVIAGMTGDLMQVPPMYSAVQVNGRRLYELARAGKEVDRPARRVHVDSFTLTAFDESTGAGEAEIRCGKGTYVRTLLHDMGQTLGCGCMMTALVRTEACGFLLTQAYTFAQVQQAADAGEAERLLIPTDTLFQTLPALRLNAMQTGHYVNGVRLSLRQLPQVAERAESVYRVYAADGRFLGIARADWQEQCLRIMKNI